MSSSTVLLIAVATITIVTCAEVSDQVKVLGDANTDFGLDVYREVAKTSNNLFISPYSISTALALTYLGARGDTKKEMEEVLYLDQLDLQSLNTNYKSLIDGIFEEDREYTLRSANSLFGQKGKVFLEDFLNSLKMYFGAPLEELDFVSDPEAARKHINEWVMGKTEDTIQELLQEGVVDATTALVLVNAIYFKGKWSMPFNASLTKDRDFQVSANEKVSVPMMMNSGPYGFVSDSELKGTLIRLPYSSDPTEASDQGSASSDLNMYVFLPHPGETLEAAETALTAFKLNSMISKLVDANLELSMPKFTITYRMSVKRTLETLGMKTTFGGGADFSGMDGTEDLHIDDVLHQSYVEVDEEGTTASAATAVIMSRSGPLPIILDRPFLFFIREEDTKSTLFLGRVSNPKTTLMARRSTYNPAAGKGHKLMSDLAISIFGLCFLVKVLLSH